MRTLEKSFMPVWRESHPVRTRSVIWITSQNTCYGLSKVSITAYSSIHAEDERLLEFASSHRVDGY